ncbi:hypothetical protein ACFWHQ_06015 [Streptomyces sp. NPDC060334]|uniref:hypothetical protein n=1 Tax=Streptomyces sp. NPDC060334 TaxID=3347099 RepID=UPI003663DB12
MYAHPTSAHPTNATGSSSWPLLPTPRTSDTNGAGTHGTGGLDLRTTVRLLPTPAARDGRSGKSNLMDRNARPLNEVIVNLLPTPTAADSERRSATFGRGNPTLTGAVTVPRSAGGKPSSNVPLPGQLTLWDA